MLCQCQFVLFTVLSLVCFAADFCRCSSSEYLIIRHGRSRVRHSSEKDHIRWGLQVFDNFTLLDYDASGGSGSGAVVNDEQTIVSSSSPSPSSSSSAQSVPWRGSGAATDGGGNAGSAGGTLTIQFNESEELERMIELSDFDNLRFGAASPGRNGASDPADPSTTRPTGSAPTTVHPPPKEGKLIKKEIMENIRRTVDKGLEYLKSHRNLDEVKIELVPFRSASKRSHSRRKASHDPEATTSSFHRSNRPEEEPFWSTSSSSARPTPTQSSSNVRISLSERQRNAIDGPQSNVGRESEVDGELNPWDEPQRNPRPPPKVSEGQVFASNQRLISLGVIPGRVGDERVALAEDTGITQHRKTSPSASEHLTDPIVIDSESRLEVEWNGQQVVSSTVQPWPTGGEDYSNDVVEDDDPSDSDRASAYVESPEGEEGETGHGAQDDDPLLQDAEEIEANGGLGDGSEPGVVEVDVTNIFHMEEAELNKLDETSRNNRRNLMKGRDVVTQFLQIVESQHLLGANCTAGTALNLGEGVVDRYAQDRFRVEAEIAVNRANMLTRIFKFSSADVQASEHLLHASVLSMVEFDDDIFAGGNCFDWNQHPAKRGLFCPFAYRLPPPDQGASLVKDLALEYHYLGNTSEWFFLARKNAEKVIARNEQYIKSFHVYTNGSERQAEEVLSVKYEDGRWSKPYYDCGGGNIWMLTYTVPFFGYENGTYFFKGTSGIDIDLRRVDIDQCSQKNSPSGAPQPLNIFAGTDKCKQRTTECIPIPGLGFRRGSYRCICRKGYYFPDTTIEQKYFNGSTLEEEYEKLMLHEYNTYSVPNTYECLPCAEGCDFCEDASPCVAALNWPMRTSILVLACAVIGLLPPAAVFTFKYQQVKVVRAASPALLRVIALGAFCIYCTSVVMYPPPSLYSCTARIWLREIGFSLTYGALMLKTWRISVIFRVRSAKAVKITDAYLLKRLGVLCGFVGIALLVRTLVAPPVVIVGRTADNLKAFLCKTDWWDHTFTSMEVLFLAWGVRLCIMVRKAPSEFNESRFISMAIYNEFLLTCFLNVSMLFLQSPANPDLLYIIFFCHTQLTVTLLLGLIFGSKVYLVFRGGGKHQDDQTGLGIKPSGAKFISRSHGRTFANASSVTTSTAQLGGNMANEGRLTETEALEELKLLYTQLQRLYERIPQRGAAILTVSSLIEACRSTSLRPPPAIGAPSPLKAIQTDGGPTVGAANSASPSAASAVVRLDKSTNTNTIATIPNGQIEAGGGGGGLTITTPVATGGPNGMLPSPTRITITDDTSDDGSGRQEEGERRQTQREARSIDGSDFRLDHQQLQCMCSDGGEALYDGDVAEGRRCTCCCTCCASNRSSGNHRQQQKQQHRRNDSVINYSNSAVQLANAGSTVNCNCKISAVSDRSGSGSGTAGQSVPLRTAKQHNSELVLNCQFAGVGNVAPTRYDHQNQQQKQHQHPPQHQRASSTSEYSEFSTKAFESCDNLLHQHQHNLHHNHHQQQQAPHQTQPTQQQQQQRQRQTSSSGDSLDNHASYASGRGGGARGAEGTLAQLSPSPATATGPATAEDERAAAEATRLVNLEKFNKLYANNSSRIDSLKEHFLMRNALTTALQNLENENRSRGVARGRLREPCGEAPEPESRVSGAPVELSASKVDGSETGGSGVDRQLSTPSAEGSAGVKRMEDGASRAVNANSSTTSNNSSSSSSSSSTGGGSTTNSPGTSTAGEGGGALGNNTEAPSSGGGKKKKSPEKRLVIDLNDRSKYTEEVSV
ncbi:uncharacterized protein LOC131294630 [Anopheles ziemanni]|uniref:uncharacterized protein LOC131265230 n=1 Tax=Anopheles coustani TaxID=139045 RepID=UPI0026582D3F|nr:uncharacterized protein LOC131265230 [Anopheles coustani]XP_058178657.1 uncharacterized protein LOC131294630 [Anopheles ziemanni]